MAILLNDNLDVAASKPTDNRYGPYASLNAANQAIPSFKRYLGLTVGIGTTNIVDYWYKSGISDSDLVEKITGVQTVFDQDLNTDSSVRFDSIYVGPATLESGYFGSFDNQDDTSSLTFFSQNGDPKVYFSPDGTVTFETAPIFQNPAGTRTNLGLGTAATANVGSNVGNVVQLQNVGGIAKLPAVDGSQLTNLPISGGNTNLSYTASPTGGTVVSDTGDDATLPLVDATNAGLMSPTDKVNLANKAWLTTFPTSQTLTADAVLTAGRNVQQSVTTYANTTINLTLPITDNSVGDLYTLILTTYVAGGGIQVRAQLHDGTGTGPQFSNYFTSSGTLKKYTFRNTTGSSGGWQLIPVESHVHNIADVTGLQTALDGKQISGTYATLEGGKIPATQLPSYVDDVLEYADSASLPVSGETGKIYITLDNDKVYRWGGTAYVEIVASPGSTDAVPEGFTNLYFTSQRAVDALETPLSEKLTKFGPYSTVGAALTAITPDKRYIGLTATVNAGALIEYWFRDGIDDTDFIIKRPAGVANESHTHIIGDISNLQDALNSKIDVSTAGPYGFASLDGSGKVQSNQAGFNYLGLKNSWEEVEALTNARRGDWVYLGGDTYILTGELPTNRFNWSPILTQDDVESVNDQTGEVVLTAADVGAAPQSHMHAIADIEDIGTAAYENVGTAIGNVVQLEDVGGVAKLPAVDASQLINLPGGSGGATNLSYTASPTGGTVVSDTGDDASLTLADTTNAGLLSPADKTKLDGIAQGAEVNVNPDWNATSGDAQILNKPIPNFIKVFLSDIQSTYTIPPGRNQRVTMSGGVTGTKTIQIDFEEWQDGDILNLEISGAVDGGGTLNINFKSTFGGYFTIASFVNTGQSGPTSVSFIRYLTRVSSTLVQSAFSLPRLIALGSEVAPWQQFGPELFDFIPKETIGGVPIINTGGFINSTRIQLPSSGGLNGTNNLPARSDHSHSNATTSASGFMSSTDKTKLDGIASGAEVNVNADWTATTGDAQILNKPTSFTPSAHSSIHHTGGTDPIAPNNISAAWAQVESTQSVDGNITLAAGRNRRINVAPSNSSSAITATITLPNVGNVTGDILTLYAPQTDQPWLSTYTIVDDSLIKATINAAFQSYTFVYRGSISGWVLLPVDTHTHPAATITTAGFMSALDKEKLDQVFSVAKSPTIYIRRFANYENSGFTGEMGVLNSLTDTQLNGRGFYKLADQYFEWDPLIWNFAGGNAFTMLLWVECGGVFNDGIRMHVRRRNIANPSQWVGFNGQIEASHITPASSNTIFTTGGGGNKFDWPGGTAARERIEIWLAAYNGGNGGYINNFVFSVL